MRFIRYFSKPGYMPWILALAVLSPAVTWAAGGGSSGEAIHFPRPLAEYNDAHIKSIGGVLNHRLAIDPFNLVATLIFMCAIIHTFLTSRFLGMAHHLAHKHEEKIAQGRAPKNSESIGAELLHFLGEVEAVFGIWAIALAAAITAFYDWHTALYYVSQKVNYTEPLFVVVIMTLASSRPILKLAELMMWKIANLFGGMLVSWWLTILTVGPILGSFITEPAAMTIAALLLGEKFYSLEPSDNFKYATLGLLFVNISVGGTLTHFAAPPVLMVAGPWNWDLMYMMTNFGWKAVVGIGLANALYFYLYRHELDQLQQKYAVVRLQRELQSQYVKREELEEEFDELEDAVSNELGFNTTFDQKCEEIKAAHKARVWQQIAGKDVDESLLEVAFEQRFNDIRAETLRKTLPGLMPLDERPPYRDPNWDHREDFVPGWIMLIHVIFMAWTVANAHYPALFIGGLLFFLGFAQATAHYQNRTNLKPPLLVGFFLAGLVIHGGLQGWWIAPVLGALGEIPLMVSATVLTAFNDNAAITYLSTLVPGFTENLKYMVVAGAVTGGGLTVIANAPNPAGQAMLKGYFNNGISPAGLLKGALIPTVIMGLCFILLRF